MRPKPGKPAARQIEQAITVRLTAEDLGILAIVQRGFDGGAAGTFIRLLHEAAIPAAAKIRFRRAPYFPDWITEGPMPVTVADTRARMLALSGFEVEADPVGPMPTRPLDAESFNRDDEPDDPDTL